MKVWVIVGREDYGGDRLSHIVSSRKRAEAYLAELCADQHRCYYGIVCWVLNEGECDP
jgi:hypothetical protein